MALTDTLQQAITHHKAGELENAEQLYRSILSEQANHPDANHNLGVLLKQGDKADIALPFFKTALENVGASESTINQLMGHKKQSISLCLYSGGLEFTRLQQEIEWIKFVLYEK